MKRTQLFLTLLVSTCCFGQEYVGLDSLKTPSEFENVFIQKIADDSLQTSVVIWIKWNVPQHYHKEHTENIVVLEGKAEMIIDGKKIVIKKGDYLNIPMGTSHAVTRVVSRKPLKVLSIQSPHFDGKDRIVIKPPHCDF